MDAQQPVPEAEDAERPPIGDLFSQLTDDVRDFARAETKWAKAQVGERWRYILPAFAMVGIGIAVLTGGFIALPIGLMFILATYTGLALSVPIVVALAALVGLALLKLAGKRIKSALKPPEDR